jgi:hypothetical protein
MTFACLTLIGLDFLAYIFCFAERQITLAFILKNVVRTRKLVYHRKLPNPVPFTKLIHGSVRVNMYSFQKKPI